ncbi:uncharacterized protein EV420DRAFT_1510358 [Desarmillaria tabescens]|uniref:Uncharacterized protein n=1 Tax=Armillaria tabescens TaxID=1929756 RepID=A0AA39NIC0_ARMTA|nr:uncharacterized protein EV420DRAFT_1510358 [Desarmillaria tabescens]KAK0466177.1 hypothetical protein EV420DRAFT_1510358 [Desarmillaria tabescens]
MYRPESGHSSYTYPLANDADPGYHGSTSVEEYNSRYSMIMGPQGVLQATPWNHPTEYYENLLSPLYNHGVPPMAVENGGYSSHPQGSWVPELSSLYGAEGRFFPAFVGEDFEATLAPPVQPGDGTRARAPVAPSNLVHVVPPIESPSRIATSPPPFHDAPDSSYHANSKLETAIRGHYSCAAGYVERKFNDETKSKFGSEAVQQIAQKFGIAYEDLFYYHRVVGEIDCICPIADCQSGQTTFKGYAIKSHIKSYHPKVISSREKVVCARMSNKGSRCPADHEVQGKHFVTHFLGRHLNAHQRCPFCDVQVGRVQNFVAHFDVCRKIEVPKKHVSKKGV